LSAESKSLSTKSKSLELALEPVSTLELDSTILEPVSLTLELKSTLTLRPVSSLKLVPLAPELFLSASELKSSFLLIIEGQGGLKEPERSSESSELSSETRGRGRGGRCREGDY
jgi:hypothetical protein